MNKVMEPLISGKIQSMLDGLRRDLAEQQRQQELQAAALREGLMDVQQQRSDIQFQRQALRVLADRCDKMGTTNDIPDGKGPVMLGSNREALDFQEELAEELASV